MRALASGSGHLEASMLRMMRGWASGWSKGCNVSCGVVGWMAVGLAPLLRIMAVMRRMAWLVACWARHTWRAGSMRWMVGSLCWRIGWPRRPGGCCDNSCPDRTSGRVC